MSKHKVALLFAITLFYVFSVLECHHQFSELQLNSYLGDIENRLKHVPNITQKLNNGSLIAYNENGAPSVNINLRNVFCVLLFFANITTLCRRQMDVVCSNPEIFGTMFDAWGKIPYTGMQVTTRVDFGTFDQCVGIDHTQGGLRTVGKYCLGGLIVPTSTNVNEENIMSNIVALATCVPDRCTGDDVFHMLGVLPIRELVNDNLCTTKLDHSTYEGNAIPILFIFLVIIAIAAISTVLDMSLQMKNEKIRLPLLTAFSFYSNGKKLFETSPVSSENKEQILCFHGLKVISMLWITAGHYAVAWEVLPLVNAAKVSGYLQERYSQYIGTAHLAVDTFFYISGFLLAYQYFKKQASRSVLTQVKSLPMLVLQRYLRLTPSILMMYLFIIGLARYFLHGPLQFAEAGLRSGCLNRWWSVFLYIENYYKWKKCLHIKSSILQANYSGGVVLRCLTTLWYVSADMQLFLVAPLIMIPIAWQLKSSFKAALGELIFFCVIFTGLPLFTKLYFPEYDPDYGEYDSHSRLVDYFIGFTFGFIIRNKRNKPFIFSNKMNFFLWFLSIGAMLGTVLVLHEINMHYGYTAKAFTYTFMRPVWCLSLCWIVYSCINGKGGAVNWILSNGFMQCGGKLTFAMYLIHSLVIFKWAIETRTKRYFSDLEMFYINMGIFIFTWVLSFFWTLLFESPIIIIMKFMFEGSGGGGRSPVQQTDKQKIIDSSQYSEDSLKPVDGAVTILDNNLNKINTKPSSESNI